MQTGEGCPLARYLITDEKEGGVLGQCQWSRPGEYGAKHHPANSREAWLSCTTQIKKKKIIIRIFSELFDNYISIDTGFDSTLRKQWTVLFTNWHTCPRR